MLRVSFTRLLTGDGTADAGGLVGAIVNGVFNRRPAAATLPAGTLQPGFALAGLQPSSTLPGFAHGGSFRVGGWGGVDSSLVAFRATPGERVDVTPPNRGSDAFRVVLVDDEREAREHALRATNERVTRGKFSTFRKTGRVV
jgi:hypothetical protein